jgi:stage V sporulation protein SpoVS
MEEQKKFQKKLLNSDDYKGAEQGAKAVKGVFGSLGALVLVVLNKDNIKAIGTGALDIAKKAIKR